MAMLLDVRKKSPCAILGIGHAVIGEEHRFDNRRFLNSKFLSNIGRLAVRDDVAPGTALTPDGLLPDSTLALADEKFREVPGVDSRLVFPGKLSELGTKAAAACLENARIAPSDVDAILVGTNTSDSYCVATEIKHQLGLPVHAFVSDVQAACSVGMTAVESAYHMAKDGSYRHVLVVCAENAINLASADNYKARNLFGSGACGMVIGRSPTQKFVFFDSGSDTHEGRIDLIQRTEQGFTQNGKAVMHFVCKFAPKRLKEILEKLEIAPELIRHIFPHQASRRVNLELEEKLGKKLPVLKTNAIFHRNVERMANTSGASTGILQSEARQAGILKPGDLCVTLTFGQGMGWGFYGSIA